MSHQQNNTDSSESFSEEKRRYSRRHFIKRAAVGLLGLFVSVPAGCSYARWIEPKWLDIVKLELTFPRLPAAWDGLKIALFSDLHLGFHLYADDMIRLTEAIHRQKPDLICFGGDFFDYSVHPYDVVLDAEPLTQLSAPYGKFAVLGNHDYVQSVKGASEVIEAAGFKLLRNEAVSLEQGQSRIWIAGVEDAMKGDPDAAKAFEATPDNEFKLLLSHCPDYADTSAKHGADLQLSGHSHGGQIRIPLVGHVVTPPQARKYVIGRYNIMEGSTQLYVNRGIGVSQLPLRFACRPELTLLTLRRA